MPRVSQAQSEIIKRRIFRAREHIECLGDPPDPEHIERLGALAEATYQFTRGFRLPSVKHLTTLKASEHRADALTNLTTVIDHDLTRLEIDSGAAEEAIIAAEEMLRAAHGIPLPVHA